MALAVALAATALTYCHAAAGDLRFEPDFKGRHSGHVLTRERVRATVGDHLARLAAYHAAKGWAPPVATIRFDGPRGDVEVIITGPKTCSRVFHGSALGWRLVTDWVEA